MADNQPPQMHADAPPVDKSDGGGYQPPPPDPQGDLEAVAALMAGTASQVGEISDNIIGESSSLQPQKFDAHTALKKHMVQSGAQPQPPQQPMQPIQPIQPVQPVQMPPAQGHVQPSIQPMPYDDGQILRRLLSIEDKLNNLDATFEKILKNVMRKNAKQITIRFNDTDDSKSK